MLSKKDLEAIKQKLEQSQNPIFFFDNDVDGLCSYIILHKCIERGKGVCVKSPELNTEYLRKVNELNPDFIFILDKPRVNDNFILEVKEKNIPMIWIDHHEIEISDIAKENIEYFNSSPSSEPVTYIVQKIFNKKENLWLAIMGCIGDHYIPEFAEIYSKENPDIFPLKKTPFGYLYETELGKLAMTLEYGLKDTTTNVLNLLKLLIDSNSPQDLIQENSKTKYLHKKYLQFNKQVQKIVSKAKILENKLVYVEYSGETSITSKISNQLSHLYPNKIIFVAYKKSDITNISLRGKNVKRILEPIIKKIPGSNGGGHEEACGARIPTDSFENFKQEFIDNIK